MFFWMKSKFSYETDRTLKYLRLVENSAHYTHAIKYRYIVVIQRYTILVGINMVVCVVYNLR